MKTKFRLINKSDNKVESFGYARDVAAFLLGRRIDNYLVIKSDELGDRLVPLPLNNPDVRNVAVVLQEK